MNINFPAKAIPGYIRSILAMLSENPSLNACDLTSVDQLNSYLSKYPTLVRYERMPRVLFVMLVVLDRNTRGGSLLITPLDQSVNGVKGDIIDCSWSEIELVPTNFQAERPEITMLYAATEDGVIGNNNSIPWTLPTDLNNFKRLTENTVVVMGRKTYESIGRALPNRMCCVLTRNPDFKADGCVVIHEFERAVRYAKELGLNKVSIIGGAKIYGATLCDADVVERSIVHGSYKGDTLVLFELDDFNLVSSIPVYKADYAGNSDDYTMERWVKK